MVDVIDQDYVQDVLGSRRFTIYEQHTHAFHGKLYASKRPACIASVCGLLLKPGHKFPCFTRSVASSFLIPEIDDNALIGELRASTYMKNAHTPSAETDIN